MRRRPSKREWSRADAVDALSRDVARERGGSPLASDYLFVIMIRLKRRVELLLTEQAPAEALQQGTSTKEGEWAARSLTAPDMLARSA